MQRRRARSLHHHRPHPTLTELSRENKTGNDVETLTATHTQEETEITRNIFDLMDKIFGLEQQVDEQKKD